MMKHSFLIFFILLSSNLIAQQQEFLNLTPTYKNSGDILRSFLKPVQFTREGINSFFTTTFNSRLYADFLGSCFVHIDDFMAHFIEHNKPISCFESTFMLFHHRIKESEWVNPYALMLFLEQLTQRLAPIVGKYTNSLVDVATHLKIITQQTQKSSFNDQWYQDQAAALINQLTTNAQLKDMQKSVTLLVESACNKLIWNPQEQNDIWQSIKILGNLCEQLLNKNIIEHQDDLNRLIWSILYRFGYFIDVAGSHLPLAFFEKIHNELEMNCPTFLTLEEQEPWLLTKKEYLINMLSRAEIKIQISQQGLLGDIAQKK